MSVSKRRDIAGSFSSDQSVRANGVADWSVQFEDGRKPDSREQRENDDGIEQSKKHHLI